MWDGFNRLNGAFGIHDGYPMSIASSVREAMKGNQYVTIFPEGLQTCRNQEVIPFNKGAFYLALENEAPVIPIAIVLYGRRILRTLSLDYTENPSSCPPSHRNEGDGFKRGRFPQKEIGRTG